MDRRSTRRVTALNDTGARDRFIDCPTLVRFLPDGQSGRGIVGLLSGSELSEVAASWTGALESWAAGERAGELTGRTFHLSDGRLLVPANDSSRGMFCVGLNYRSHLDEVGGSLGEPESNKPVIFSKLRDSLVAAGEPLELTDNGSSEFDWEVELAVVIGRRGWHISHTAAFEHVAGYTLVNDVTARDVQRAHSQWFLGKNVRGSTPVGPFVVHRDCFAWPPDVHLRLSVNGDVKQHANTSRMIHSVARLIETISTYVELKVGDIIATGSPEGVGFRREPPEFLTKGDIVRAELVDVMYMENLVQ